MDGWDRKGSRAGRPIQRRPPDHPLVRGRPARPRPAGTRRWTCIVERSRARARSDYGAGSHRVLQLRPADARGVLHPRGRRRGRHRHVARRRQHAAVHRHGGVPRSWSRSARTAPRLLTDFDVTDALFLVGHNMAVDPDGALGARPRPARRAHRPTLVVVDPRRDHGGSPRGRPPRPAPGNESPAAERPAADPLSAAGSTRAFIQAHTIGIEALSGHRTMDARARRTGRLATRRRASRRRPRSSAPPRRSSRPASRASISRSRPRRRPSR